MLLEISVAVNYILSHLYNKLPRRRVNNFGEELERYLHAKFQQHWYPDDPLRDASYRCLNAVGQQVDFILPEAAVVSGLDWSEIQACLPDGLILTVDPGHVTCQYNQTTYPIPDLQQQHSAPCWSTTPLSLSSSGCSSASSSISSTHLTPTTNPVTQHVLYTVQGSWNNNTEPTLAPTDAYAITSASNVLGNVSSNREPEQGDNLATATALSVLIDPEENAHENSMGVKIDNDIQEPMNTWKLDNIDFNLETPLKDLGFSSASSSKLELINNCDINGWNYMPRGMETEQNLLTMLNNNHELIDHLDQPIGMNFHEPMSIAPPPAFNRSASNPQQPHRFNTFQDNNSHPTTNSLLSTIQSKFDRLYNNHTVTNHNNTNNQLPPPCSTVIPPTASSSNSFISFGTNVNPYVQKSTSTPSFTAATFAQTKFGSTKLKSYSKRPPNRLLSPHGMQPQQPQTFNDTINGGGIPRESIISALLSAQQQRNTSATTNTTSSSAVLNRYTTPLLLTDLNMGQRVSHPHHHHPPATAFNSADSSYPTDSMGSNSYHHQAKADQLNNTPDNRAQFLFGGVTSFNSKTTMNTLDDLLTPHLEDTNGEVSTFKRTPCNMNGAEQSMHTKPVDRWTLEMMRTGREGLSAAGANTTSRTINSMEMALLRNGGFHEYSCGLVSNRTGSTVGGQAKIDNEVGNDEAIISTRMVNLLLEDDTLTDGMLQQGNENTSLMELATDLIGNNENHLNIEGVSATCQTNGDLMNENNSFKVGGLELT